jgi:hypothetical protein
MSIPLVLVDALRVVNLEPGRVYRERVDGKTFVVQLLPESDDEPTPELAEQVMLLPWFESPELPGGFIVRATPGPLSPPDPPIIPDDETTE